MKKNNRVSVWRNSYEGINSQWGLISYGLWCELTVQHINKFVVATLPDGTEKHMREKDALEKGYDFFARVAFVADGGKYGRKDQVCVMNL